MSTTANRRQHAMGARKVDRFDDVAAVRTARDQRRMAIEYAVPDLASLFVSIVSGQQELAAQAGSKSLDVGTRNRKLFAVERNGRQLFGQFDVVRIRPGTTQRKSGGRQS